MPPFFTLRQVVSQTRARPADVLDVKRALNRMGFYDVPDYGMTPHADRTMFDGIRRFQRANGLRVDGVMRRGHATERAMNDALRLASAEKLEGSKLSLADAQRIKELEDRLKELNASIKGFQSLIRHARNAGRPVSVFYFTKEMFSRVEEKKQIEADLSRLKGE